MEVNPINIHHKHYDDEKEEEQAEQSSASAKDQEENQEQSGERTNASSSTTHTSENDEEQEEATTTAAPEESTEVQHSTHAEVYQDHDDDGDRKSITSAKEEQPESKLEIRATDEEPEKSQDVEDYDPELTFSVSSLPPRPKTEPVESKEPSNPIPISDDDDDDDYDPELALKNEPTLTAKQAATTPPPPVPLTSQKSELTPSKPNFSGKSPVGLPPKPPVSASQSRGSGSGGRHSKKRKDSQHQLKQAYEAVMHSEIAKDPNFVNLPQSEQLKLIAEQLNQQGIQLTSPEKHMNYDQVYSYNKPYKNLKDPIPLIPINEFCRRPNITAPMTPEEEQAYDDFIKKETYYMGLLNWDEFPDKLRLFIGNLPANTISKQDLFRIFSQYGEVIQIAIKAGYGFVQFRTAEACLECIKGETGVPLHNKIMRLDASKPQKSRRPGKPEINNPNLSSRGRERSITDEQQPPSKKRKPDNLDCMVYITGKSSVFFIRKVKKAFAQAQITIDTEDVTHRNINEVISEAAYSGVLGACVVKELKVDIQTFETTPDGGVRFDEYADIDPDVGADLLAKAKLKRYGGQPPPYYPQDTSYNDNSYPPQLQRQQHEPQPQPYDQYMGFNQGPGSGSHGGGRKRRDRRRDRDRDRDRRGPRHSGGGRGGDMGGYGPSQGYDNSWAGDHHGAAPPPQQYNQYGEPSQPVDQYRPSPPQGYNQFGGPPPPPQPPVQQYPPPAQDQGNLLLALQGLNPQQVQSMISLLQQQQQQQSPSPQIPQQYRQPSAYGSSGGYNQPPQQQPYGSAPPLPHQQRQASSSSNSQVNALLSQLQNQRGGGNGIGYATQPPTSQLQQNSTQSLMDTLARLARK